uniref:tyrosinase n=1 Tax=Trametes sanguinea TaxID=158606 RepID=Q2TL94_9APHY|nr:tyrosinase [Trametes sanguinea]AAX46018.1 tyrosinase [Trametes sanguinea]
MSHFIVTGPVGGQTEGAPAPNRLEINDFVKNEEFFSLYVQALDIMYGLKQEELISFFQIGGIHGLPYVAWSDAGADDPAEPSGYCTHGSVLFPTWHRPYVALYEQILHKYAGEIADKYTVDKPRWQKAAADLRQPFWDWAKNTLPPPEVISLDKVTITTPDGQRTQVDNPLRRYRFHPIDPSFPEPYSNWPATLRHPTSDGSDAKDNVKDLTTTLKADQPDITTKTYNLLTRVHTWPAFSNHTPGDGGSSSNSLEAIHDHIHDSVGGGGQMGDPSVAGFDPIFFLHHCQVDRLLALWSALNPGVWVNSSSSEDGTYTIPPDSTVDQTTALTPFWDTQSTFWTSFQSAGVSPSQFGYSYPEFNGLNLQDQKAVKDHIAEVVNELYGHRMRKTFPFPQLQAVSVAKQGDAVTPSVATDSVSSSTTPAENPASREDASDKDTEPTLNVEVAAPGAHLTSTKYWDWTARIHVKKYEVGGSFSVLLFLGAIPENPADWRTSPNYVGGHHAFVNSSPQRCANCRGQGDLVIEGFVHLNEAIARHAHLDSFDPTVVRPYLTRELHWGVMKVNGTVVPLQDVPSLEVVVLSTPLTLPPGEPFPVPGTPVNHHDITHGRPGGSHHTH